MWITLKTVVVVLLLIAAATFGLLQRQENQRLMVQLATLRQQVGQALSLRVENRRLAERLGKTTQTDQADEAELLRLRDETSRLGQLELGHDQPHQPFTRSFRITLRWRAGGRV